MIVQGEQWSALQGWRLIEGRVVEKFLNSDMQTVQQNHKCHDFCMRQNISQKRSEESVLWKWDQKITSQPTSQYLLSDLPAVHIWKILPLLLSVNPSQTSCYYGKRAARLTSKPITFIFISLAMLPIQTVIHLQQMLTSKINCLQITFKAESVSAALFVTKTPAFATKACWRAALEPISVTATHQKVA